MPKAHVPPELVGAPFTYAQALDHGLTRFALRGKQWRRLLRGVWVHASVSDSRELWVAAVKLVLGENAFVCGATAAWIHGIDVRDTRSELVWIGSRTGLRPRLRAGCLVREITVTDGDLELIDGVLVTTPTRTVFDCARWLSVMEGVVVADALGHLGLLSAADLVAYR